MKKYMVVLAMLLMLPSITLAVSAKDVPPLLKAGFEKYATDGPKAAIESWTKGSAIEGSKEALSQANSFRQIEDFYGKYIGYEFVKAHQIAASTTAYLLNIKYEKGNLFSLFFLYKKPDGNQVITSFNFHTSAQAIWPSSAVFGCGE